MADNQDIAFKIFDEINKKQKEQLKNKTLKPEAVIDFSEHDFVEDLQRNVNRYTKNIENTRIIDDVYKNILKSVEGISSLDEITTSSGIKIPESMILESIDIALNEEKSRNFSNENKTTLAQIALNAVTVKEFMNAYNEMSKDEQKEFKENLYNVAFGTEISKMVLEQEAINEIMKESDPYKLATEEERNEADKVSERYNPLKYIYKGFGIDYEKINTPEKQLIFAGILTKLKANVRNGTEVIEEDLSDFLYELGIDNPREFIANTFQKLQENPEGIKGITELEELLKRNKEKLFQHQDEIKQFLSQQFSPNLAEVMTFDDIVHCLATAFDEDGKINALKAQANIKYVLEKTRDDGKSYAERFGIILESREKWESFKMGIGFLNQEMDKDSVIDIDDIGVLPEEKDEDIEQVELGIFEDLDMGLSEEYSFISDDFFTDYMRAASEELIVDKSILQEAMELKEQGEHEEIHLESSTSSNELIDSTYLGSAEEIQIDSSEIEHTDRGSSNNENDTRRTSNDSFGIATFKKVIKTLEIINEDAKKELTPIQQLVYGTVGLEEIEESQSK